jgi:MFS family permease
MIGPAMTGMLLALHVSLAVCFFINGLSFLAVIAGLMQMRLPPTVHKPRDEQVFKTILEGLAYVRHAPTVRRVLIFVGAFGTFAFSYNVLLPAFVRFYLARDLMHNFDLQGSKYGALESARGIGAFIAAITAATLAKRRLQARLILIGATGWTIGLLVFSMMRSLVPAYIVIACVAFSFVLCLSSAQTLVQLHVPDHLRGRVMSVYVLLNNGTAPIGSIMAGAVAKSFGTPVAIRTGVFLALALTTVGIGAEALHRHHGKTAGSAGT